MIYVQNREEEARQSHGRARDVVEEREVHHGLCAREHADSCELSTSVALNPIQPRDVRLVTAHVADFKVDHVATTRDAHTAQVQARWFAEVRSKTAKVAVPC